MTTLAVLEQRDGVLRKISHEVVTAAQRLGGGVEAVVCAAGVVQGADQAAKFGADKIVTLTNPAFAKYAPEACAQALAERAKQGGHRSIVFAASATGKDLAPRVAAKLGVSVAGDLTDLATDGHASGVCGESTPESKSHGAARRAVVATQRLHTGGAA